MPCSASASAFHVSQKNPRPSLKRRGVIIKMPVRLVGFIKIPKFQLNLGAVLDSQFKYILTHCLSGNNLADCIGSGLLTLTRLRPE